MVGTWHAGQVFFNRAYDFYSNAAGNNSNVQAITDLLTTARTQTFTYDGLNRLVTAGESAWEVQFGYDAWGNRLSQTAVRGNVVQPTFTVNGKNQITNSFFQYDAAGNLTHDGTRVFEYDAENRITRVDNGAALYSYYPTGERASKSVGADQTEYFYFAGQPIAERKADGAWSDYVYAEGKRIVRGNSYSQFIHIHGNNTAAGAYSGFTFPLTSEYAKGYTIRSGDKLFLLQCQTGAGRGGIGIWFSDGTVTNDVTYDQANELLNSSSMVGYWHNRRADLSAFAGKTIDHIAVLADARSALGLWDIYFQDVALISTDGAVHPLFYGQTNVAFQAWGSAGVTERTSEIYRNPNMGPYPNVSTFYYHGDHLGSARLLSSDGGYPVWQATYLPFGEEFEPLPTTNHYKFTGKERDTETGLDYFGARYYGGNMGRFLSPDWSAVPEPVPYADLSNPQTLNLYQYVGNNPLATADADGHCWPPSACADVVDSWVQTFRQDGMSANNLTSSPTLAAINTFANGVTADLASGAADVLRLGNGTAAAIDSAKQGDYAGAAIGLAQDGGRAAGVILAVTGVAAKGEAPVAKEGIYEGPDATAPGKTYVGQSENIPRRLNEHQASGKFESGAKVKTTEVKGGKTAREVAEQKRINQLGGVRSNPGSKTSNIRNPIGKNRAHLMKDEQ